MRKIGICAIALTIAFILSCCNGNKNTSSDTVMHDTNVAAQMYEYTEEVPIPAPGQQDPSVTEAKTGKKPYIADFSATWCGPCQKLKPYFKQYEEVYKGQADFVTIDVDENKALARKHNIQSVPTVIIFSDSTMTQELFRLEGFAPQQLEEAIMENL